MYDAHTVGDDDVERRACAQRQICGRIDRVDVPGVRFDESDADHGYQNRGHNGDAGCTD